jgi:XRE family transcriptional regulator, regulator of sulfur utilization
MEEDSVMTTQHRVPGRFAQTLARLRSTARLSREELARRAGVSVDLVHSLEQGRTANPTLRTLLRLADALGVTVGELIEDAGECSNGGTAPCE